MDNQPEKRRLIYANIVKGYVRENSMARITHGAILSLEQLIADRTRNLEIDGNLTAVENPCALPALTHFGFLFPSLQRNPDNLLLESVNTVADLKNLAATMRDPGPDIVADSNIPAAYTYFGQFVDHDITLEVKSDTLADIADKDLTPITLDDVSQKLMNARSPNLDLDSI